MYPYPVSIPEAARFLDQVEKGWEKKIDKSKLNMVGNSSCILGKVFSGWHNAMRKYFGDNVFDNGIERYAGDHIFGREASLADWFKEIDKRMSKEWCVPPTELTFIQAYQAMLDGKKVVCLKGWSNVRKYAYVIDGVPHIYFCGGSKERLDSCFEIGFNSKWKIFDENEEKRKELEKQIARNDEYGKELREKLAQLS